LYGRRVDPADRSLLPTSRFRRRVEPLPRPDASRSGRRVPVQVDGFGPAPNRRSGASWRVLFSRCSDVPHRPARRALAGAWCAPLPSVLWARSGRFRRAAGGAVFRKVLSRVPENFFPSAQAELLAGMRFLPQFRGNRGHLQVSPLLNAQSYISIHIDVIPHREPMYLGRIQVGTREVSPYLRRIREPFRKGGVARLPKFATDPIVCGVSRCEALTEPLCSAVRD